MATADATNSFATVAEAAAYFDTRLHSGAWEDADDPEREVALIQSTRVLLTYLEWIGEAPKPGAAPDNVKQACFEMALVLLTEDKQVVNDLDGISSLTINGVMSLDIAGAKQMIPTYIQVMLGGLIAGSSGSFGITEIIRG